MTAPAPPRAARAIADLTSGTILASVENAAAPERVFPALTSDDITRWWGAEDLYRTTKFTADLRVGGKWRSDGKGADGSPFHVEGEYLAIDPPRLLVHTWKPVWEPGEPTTVTYRLEPTATGTKLTLRHEGFVGRAESCEGHAQGWERVLGWLDGFFTTVTAAALGDAFFFCRLIPPRPSFAQDMTPEERTMMGEHAAYWREHLAAGRAIVFGPVADPAGAWGLGVVRVKDEAEARAFEAGDPAVSSGRGFRYEILPMPRAVFRE
jgi:uncharacterized protein YndB with AHSA1/START domain